MRVVWMLKSMVIVHNSSVPGRYMMHAQLRAFLVLPVEYRKRIGAKKRMLPWL